MRGLNNLPDTAQTPLFDALPLQDIARLRSVSNALNSDVRQYDHSAFGFEKLYGQFFPLESQRTIFLKKQAETEALVSGSTLVSVLSRDGFKPSDLDVFLQQKHVMSMGQTIMELNYKFVPLSTVMEGNKKKSEQQMDIFEEAVLAELSSWVPNTGDITDRYKNSAIAGVFNFAKDSGEKIQLVATRGEPIEAILGFHSTLVMNFATTTHICSLYPTKSFINKEAIYVKDFTLPVIKAVQKYEQRGWSTVNMISAEEALDGNSEISFKTRWIGDSHCWITKLPDIPNFTTPSDAYRNLWTTSWHIHCPGPHSIRLVINRFQSRSLQQSYLVTWEVEKAIWAHPCFRMLEEKIRWRMANRYQGNTSDGQPNSPVNNTHDTELGREPTWTSSRRINTPFSKNDESQWLYVFDPKVCNHRSTSNVADLEDAVVEYLHELYPMFDETFKANEVIRRMRDEFAMARRFYNGMKGPCSYATGHTISAIMRFVDTVKRIQFKDTVKFTLRFSQKKRQMVWTTCIVFVRPEFILPIKKELATWPGEVFDSSRVIMRVATDLD
ncbi:hypothetical protein VNI00_013391 [Paramarasmius palmivorus]|uniref:F-box domain-containing protein n=1 Tax=Paramarasmius palmivorus TaxID=297713 RepID=A0AAW0BZG0_9AGAR